MPSRLVALATLHVLLAACAADANGGATGMMDGGHGMHGGGGAPAPLAGAEVVDVELGDLYFAPTEIGLTAGETVNIQATNVGATFHDFTVDAADFMLDVEAGETSSGALRIDEPGSYEYRCTVPGHADAGMIGSIVVSDG